MRLKIIILRLARSIGAFRCARHLTRRAARILCYHGIWLGDDGFPGDGMYMRAETFRARLDHLAVNGYPVITLQSAVECLRHERDLPHAPVIITIDDGWYSTFAKMLPALREYGFPATLYCDTRHLVAGEPLSHMMAQYFRRISVVETTAAGAEQFYQQALDPGMPSTERSTAALAFGREVGIDPEPYLTGRVFEYMTPDELRSFANSPGCSVELHTHRHTMGDHSAEVIGQEIADNRAALARLLGRDPESFTHFCYPSGVFSRNAADHLAELGIVSATSTQQGLAFPSADVMLLPRILDGENLSMLEFEAEVSGFMHLLRKVTGRCRIGYDAPHS